MAVDLFVLVSCCSAIAALGLIIFTKNPLEPDKKRFLFLSIALIAWAVFNFFADNADSNLLFFNQLTFFSGVGAIYFMMNFIYHYPNNVRKNSKHYALFSIYTLVLLPMIFSPQFISSIGHAGPGSMDTSFLYYVFIAYVTYSFILLISAVKIQYDRAVSNVQKGQVTIVSLGFIIYAILTVGSNVFLPLITDNWASSRFGPLFTLLFVAIIFYAIVKHHLFDIRLAVVRTLTYALSLATLSVVYYYIAYLVSLFFFEGHTDSSISLGPANIALALVLAFIFQPVKRFFDRITNRIFYKDNYNTDDFFARLNNTLTQTTEIRGLLTKVSYTVSDTLKAEQAFFFVYTNADGHYLTAGTDGHNHIPKNDAILIEQECDGKNDVIVASLLEEGDIIKRMMLSHKIEIILPLIEDGRVIGYFCLGEHKTSGYTSRDTKVLNTISNELIVAIKNALAVEEIREINRTLQQRINNATRELRSTNATLRQLDKVKDEFVSIASHQLRTPLTSVKGYLSMVLEGDTGKITKTQHQLLNEAFLSSERMVRLINDFLNVSRIQTGKFIIDRAPTDLSTVVEQEMESLKPNAQARNMKLVYKKPNNFPILNIDEGKIRQVIMNFTDNAIYYSRDDSAINIKLSVETNNVVFTVKDTGIGVPKSERDNLFGKFYRASNARKKRPDGTGVGLYLAKKVIDAHEGELVFESIEGKGSTFGFKLPITKNS